VTDADRITELEETLRQRDQRIAELERTLQATTTPAVEAPPREVPVLSAETLDRFEGQLNSYRTAAEVLTVGIEALQRIQAEAFAEVRGLLEQARALPHTLRDRARTLPRATPKLPCGMRLMFSHGEKPAALRDTR
jgi:prefoldin subunit 5